MPTVHVRLDAQQNALWKQLAAAYGQLPGSFARAKLVDVLQHARMEGPDFLLSDPDFTLPRKGRTRQVKLRLYGEELEMVGRWMKYWHEPRFGRCVRRMLLTFMNQTPAISNEEVSAIQDGISQMIRIGVNLNQLARQINAEKWDGRPGIDLADIKQIKMQLAMATRAVENFRRRARRVLVAANSGRRELPE